MLIFQRTTSQNLHTNVIFLIAKRLPINILTGTAGNAHSADRSAGT